MDYQERVSKNLSPEESAAYHEAGHVVVAHVLGGKVERVCIVSLAEASRDESRFAGCTSVIWDGNEGPLASLIYELAGYAAEEFMTGQSGRFQDYPEEWQGVRDHVQG